MFSRLFGSTVTATCAVLIGATAHAQIALGIKSGINLSDVVINNVTSPDAESDYRMKTGLHAGFFAQVDGSTVGLAAELLYSNKGVRTVNTNVRLHYVSIPLLLRYRLHTKWIAEAGPELSYLATANSKYGNLNAVWDNKLDIGIDAGLQFTTGKIILGSRFNAGMSSVIRNGSLVGSNEKVRYQNRVLQFYVALRLIEFKN